MVSEGAKKESRLPRPPRYALPTAASAEAKRQILAEYNYTGPAVGNAGTPVARKRKSESGESPAGSPKRRGYARGVLAAGADDNVDLEDVPALLAERMVGKSKFDYKGKCEQMSSYIKRLRAACSVMLDQTSGFSGERERLSAMLVELDEQGRRRSAPRTLRAARPSARGGRHSVRATQSWPCKLTLAAGRPTRASARTPPPARRRARRPQGSAEQARGRPREPDQGEGRRGGKAAGCLRGQPQAL